MKTTVTCCPAERTLQLIAGRWKIFILHQLFDGTLRFSELQRAVNAITSSHVTPKVLTQELRQMESDGLITRQVYAQVPPKVEYSLTPLGASLRPVVDAMVEWGPPTSRADSNAQLTRQPQLAERCKGGEPHWRLTKLRCARARRVGAAARRKRVCSRG